VDGRADIIPGLAEDRDFEAPLSGELEQVKPQVVRRFLGVETFDVPGIHMHGVDGRFAIVEPEGCVVAGWRLVRRASRIVIGFQR
jgi:hypothetical protein